jgi:hypothetical protein
VVVVDRIGGLALRVRDCASAVTGNIVSTANRSVMVRFKINSPLVELDLIVSAEFQGILRANVSQARFNQERLSIVVRSRRDATGFAQRLLFRVFRVA